MTQILFPDNEQRSLLWYLAAEQHLCEHMPADDDMLMLWQSRPTVIVGHHQDIAAEVNLAWCEANGVEVCRRKSGGGCVYSDEGNLMLSYVTKCKEPQVAFARFLDMLVDTLQKLGLPAVSSTHNDIMIGDRKVSGNACFAAANGTIVHGTLLWHSDMERLTMAITPSEAKLAKHAVQSVRQRVINLYDLGITDFDALKKHIVSNLCTDSLTLTTQDIQAIDRLM